MTGDGMPRLVVAHASVVAEGGVLEDGWVVASDRVEALGTGRPPELNLPVIDATGLWLTPGFVDLHCHGGGGRSLYSGDVDDVRVAAAVHRASGTTSMLASIGSMELTSMLDAARAVATAIDDGSAPNVVGIHFEGPFLSPRRAGAQTPTALLEPSDAVLDRLLDAAGGHALMMTIAPELPGAVELIARRAGDLRFALGHTDADDVAFTAGADAGARHVTHLFNAMPPLTHRSPGPVARALLDDRMTVEVIADGHHLAADTVRLTLRAAGPERVVLVTDAMPAAGLIDGHYAFADREVEVVDGAAHLQGTDTLAGSTLLLAKAVRRLVAELGVPVPDAVRMASTNAADRMGWSGRGRIAIGARADLVLLTKTGEFVDTVIPRP